MLTETLGFLAAAATGEAVVIDRMERDARSFDVSVRVMG